MSLVKDVCDYLGWNGWPGKERYGRFVCQFLPVHKQADGQKRTALSSAAWYQQEFMKSGKGKAVTLVGSASHERALPFIGGLPNVTQPLTSCHMLVT
jgi:hypothetical protein